MVYPQAQTRIMVVEGDAAYCRYLVDYFRQREFETVGFQSHGDALERLRDDIFDVAIIDFKIDGASADALCRHIIANHHDFTSLIIMNSEQSFDNELHIRCLSPVFYLVKPFSVEDLYAVVLKIAERKERMELTRNNTNVEAVEL
jgi:DNA-binding response OmpR family regulator